MKTFSNRNYLRSLSPQASSNGSMSTTILGISLSSLGLVAMVLWVKYRRQNELLNDLRRRNAVLQEELDAHKITVDSQDLPAVGEEPGVESAN